MFPKIRSFSALLLVALPGSLLAAGPNPPPSHGGRSRISSFPLGGARIGPPRFGGFHPGGFRFGGSGFGRFHAGFGYRPFYGPYRASWYRRSYHPFYPFFTYYPYLPGTVYPVLLYPYLLGVPDYSRSDENDEPEDDNSMPPESRRRRPKDRVAHIKVEAPADAAVWFDGHRTRATGPVRRFHSPPLAPRRQYDYKIRAVWTDRGRKVTQTQEITVSAGSWLTVKFPQ